MIHEHPTEGQMKARYWEKLWSDILKDKKLWPLDNALKWRFVTCIIMAGIEGKGGLLPSLDDMCYHLAHERITPEQLRLELSTLAKRELVELVSFEEEERWFVTNYAKRQAPVSDRDRKRRSRDFQNASAASAALGKEFEEIEEEQKKQKKQTNVTSRDNYVTNELLTAAGIARNRTTARLWDLDPDYVRAHIEASETAALAIRRMLDGDPAPRGRRKIREEDYQDIIQR